MAGATLTAVTACAIGVPMPASAVRPSLERFPCETHPCGCADAASCWRDCCCLTNAAKLAWARRNGVAPPAFVAAAAKCELVAFTATSTGASGACCLHADRAAKSTSPGTCASHPAQAAAQSAARRYAPGVQIVAAMKCRGLAVSVALLPPSLPVGAGCVVPLPPPLRRAASFVAPRKYDPPYLAVATPPPDAACA